MPRRNLNLFGRARPRLMALSCCDDEPEGCDYPLMPRWPKAPLPYPHFTRWPMVKVVLPPRRGAVSLSARAELPVAVRRRRLKF